MAPQRNGQEKKRGLYGVLACTGLYYLNQGTYASCINGILYKIVKLLGLSPGSMPWERKAVFTGECHKISRAS